MYEKACAVGAGSGNDFRLLFGVECARAEGGAKASGTPVVAAHLWASDARPYKLQSGSDVKGDDNKGRGGKTMMWRGAFASEQLRSSMPYTWLGTDLPDAQRGVDHGTQDNYLPGNAFDVAFLKVDSDKAFDVAQKHGGDKLADMPVMYFLEWNRSDNNLVWHVIYGISRNDAKLAVDVDASTGEFLRKEK